MDRSIKLEYEAMNENTSSFQGEIMNFKLKFDFICLNLCMLIMKIKLSIQNALRVEDSL